APRRPRHQARGRRRRPLRVRSVVPRPRQHRPRVLRPARLRGKRDERHAEGREAVLCVATPGRWSARFLGGRHRRGGVSQVSSTEAKVAHVWRRLGFGPGPDDVAAGVAAGGAAATIENLLSRPAPPVANWQWPGGTVNNAAMNDATRLVELMATSYPQVRERIAWILQGILVIAWGEVIGPAEME